jgi:predicted nucleic acid-binding protein
MILLDTDVCLGLLGGNTKVLELYADYPDEICVPFVSVQELYGAASRSSNATENTAIIETFLLGVTVFISNL